MTANEEWVICVRLILTLSARALFSLNLSTHNQDGTIPGDNFSASKAEQNYIYAYGVTQICVPAPAVQPVFTILKANTSLFFTFHPLYIIEFAQSQGKNNTHEFQPYLHMLRTLLCADQIAEITLIF